VSDDEVWKATEKRRVFMQVRRGGGSKRRPSGDWCFLLLRAFVGAWYARKRSSAANARCQVRRGSSARSRHGKVAAADDKAQFAAHRDGVSNNAPNGDIDNTTIRPDAA